MEDLFWNLNFDEQSDASDPEYYPGDGEISDDDDDELDSAPETNLHPLKLDSMIMRFVGTTQIPQNQIYITPLPQLSSKDKSPFSLSQWEKLRSQCRWNFGLLLRSLCFSLFTAPSEPVLNGFIALIHSFSEIFLSSVSVSNDLNGMLGFRAFVPVLGDPETSSIRFGPNIVEHFLKGGNIDDLVDFSENSLFSNFVLEFPFLRDKPNLNQEHQNWYDCEESLLSIVKQRTTDPSLIQKFAIPVKTIESITLYSSNQIRNGFQYSFNDPINGLSGLIPPHISPEVNHQPIYHNNNRNSNLNQNLNINIASPANLNVDRNTHMFNPEFQITNPMQNQNMNFGMVLNNQNIIPNQMIRNQNMIQNVNYITNMNSIMPNQIQMFQRQNVPIPTQLNTFMQMANTNDQIIQQVPLEDTQDQRDSFSIQGIIEPSISQLIPKELQPIPENSIQQDDKFVYDPSKDSFTTTNLIDPK